MINESFIERIVREEVRNYLFGVGVVGTSKRKRKPVTIGPVNLEADATRRGLSEYRKETFVSKIADIPVNGHLEFKMPPNVTRDKFMTQMEAKVGYSRKRTGFTLVGERHDNGFRIYRTT